MIAGNSNGTHMNKTPFMNVSVPTFKKNTDDPKTANMMIKKATILDNRSESLKIADIVFITNFCTRALSSPNSA